MTGTLHGIGVGPGDPELLTLKAARLLAQLPTIAFLHPPGRPPRARSIVAAHLAASVTEIAEAMPMQGDPRATGPVYDRLAERIDEALRAGDVGFLCEGDPMLFGSFLAVLERARPAWRIAAVPGITSACAAAAAALRPLARGTQSLTIVPATAPEPELTAALARPGPLVILKLGRHLDRVRGALRATGREAGAILAVEVGTPEQALLPLPEATRAPYFALILVPGRPG